MKDLFREILKGNEKLSIIGLGYVGLPLAVAFSEVVDVIGFDLDNKKIELYKDGLDITNEVGNEKLKEAQINFTNDENIIKEAIFHIIAVPTPITKDKKPNLNPIITASEIVGRNMKENSIVVYESTVYPGVTEDICVPILEKLSGLKYGEQFKVGYSPERINPGDRVHTVDKIVKIVSGMDKESLNIIAKMYSIIIKAGVHKAESIKVAEGAKVIENAQRDINIAFVNELSIIFGKLGIDTKSVLKAANTKWNFLDFTPGLVGGHCIGVDPYYLTYKAEEIGYHPEVILSGRRINDNMGKYAAENTIKQLIKTGKAINNSKVLIMGITFKENVPDVRNSKVIDIYNELIEYGLSVSVCDYEADKDEVYKEYGIEITNIEDVSNVDAIIIAVSHDKYKNMTFDEIKKLYLDEKMVLVDLKGIFDKDKTINENCLYWRF